MRFWIENSILHVYNITIKAIVLNIVFNFAGFILGLKQNLIHMKMSTVLSA